MACMFRDGLITESPKGDRRGHQKTSSLPALEAVVGVQGHPLMALEAGQGLSQSEWIEK